MRKPLIGFTGASGRVGRQILPLLGESWSIRGLDLRPGNVSGIEVHPVDLLDQAATLDALCGTSAIVHCAIATYPQGQEDNSEAREEYNRKMLDVNIKGTYNVFEAARILQIPQVIYISSLTVMTGYLPDTSDLDEQLLPNPRNVYACTKLFGEQMAQLYSRAHGVRTICLRIAQPYPLGLEQEKDWLADSYSRAYLVSHADIARAIDSSLRADHVHRGVYNIVSRNGQGVIAHSAAREIGYEPVDCF